MRDDALESLSQLRKAEVDRAVQHLTRIRQKLIELEVALDALHARRAELDVALQRARAATHSARDVVSLRWSEDHVRALRGERTVLEGRLGALMRQRSSLCDEVRAAEASVLAHEVGRRAVDRTLERRADARAKADERRAETEVDDALRPRRR